MSPRVALLAIVLASCGDRRDPGGEAPSLDPEAASRATTRASGGPARVGAPSASAWAGVRKVALEAGAMGTRVTLSTFAGPGDDEGTIRPKLEAALAEIKRLEGLMTTWREDSELSAVNRRAGGAAVAVGPETYAVIEKSLWIAGKSEGVFDITFDVMKGLWKFDEGVDERIPTQAEIDSKRPLIDWRRIQLDAKSRTVRLAQKGMRVSLGGIAKGYAVDAAAKKLRDAGLTSFVVQAGGDLYVAGKKPDGTRYRVGARDPRGKGPEDFFALVEVEDHAFSTAGDYERSFLKDGKRYHHIIDPRTGWPAEASRSVTIWAADAFTADALDDAVFILGPEKGLALVESIDGAGAVVVDRDGKVWISKRLVGKVVTVHPPANGP